MLDRYILPPCQAENGAGTMNDGAWWNRSLHLASSNVAASTCGRSVMDAAARNAHAIINPTGSCTFRVVAGSSYLQETGNAEC